MRAFVIGKSFTFAASHVLSGLPEGHQCGRLHGHNYTVCLELAGAELDPVGFVRDFGDLASFRTMLDTELDHRHLNEVLPFNPTAENLAAWLFGRADRLYGTDARAVTVWETPTSWARYQPSS